MTGNAFSDVVRAHLRASGYSQKNLADELGLHPKVLSRKLHGSSNAHLTQLEIRQIVTTLALWKVITTQDEAVQLLELANLNAASFSAEEWRSFPLHQLVVENARPTSSSHPQLSSSPPPPRHNLPAPTTRLIGREWSIEQLKHLLGREEVRLVTLIGAGGSGKTRLALHLASAIVKAFPQGVWFVPLAGVNNPPLVLMSILQVLGLMPSPGVTPVQCLIDHLREKKMLLVLDNFEHVLEAASSLGELLAGAPGLKMLITSRVVLHLYGECEFNVSPLAVPDPTVLLDTPTLSQYGAIQLFVERVQAVVPGFKLTAENGVAIAQICARLDGLPLALELAAARVKLLPPAQLVERLKETRLDVLNRGARNMPDRQQTLRDTIAWSYHLLSLEEQVWFSRLAIFNGGWSLEAGEAMMQGVGGASEEGGGSAATSGKYVSSPASSFLNLLEQLVDKSLVVRQPDAGSGQVRFTMLETIREYALERLAAHKELERLRDWHAYYYLGIVEAAEIGLRGPRQLTWLEQLVAEQENIRAALEWLQRGARITMGDPLHPEESEEGASHTLAIERLLRFAASLRPYWEWKGYLTEGRLWLEAALDLPLADGATPKLLAARAKALSEASRLVCLQNEQMRAIELAEESIALWEKVGDQNGLAGALFHRGWPAHVLGDLELARKVYERALQLLSTGDNLWLRAQLLFYLGAVAGFSADFERMRSLYTQSKMLFERVGDSSSVADVLKDLGGMSVIEGKYSEAVACLLKSIDMCYELGHKQFIATGMGMLSYAVGMKGEPDVATASIQSARLGGAAEAMFDTIGLNQWTESHPVVMSMRQFIRARVDEQSWDEAWAAGRSLTVEQAISLVHSYNQVERVLS